MINLISKSFVNAYETKNRAVISNLFQWLTSTGFSMKLPWDTYTTGLNWWWVNIGSGNGMLPDDTKPLPEPVLTYHQWGPGQWHKRYISHQSLKSDWKYLKFNSNLPGANELNSLFSESTALPHGNQYFMKYMLTWIPHTQRYAFDMLITSDG